MSKLSFVFSSQHHSLSPSPPLCHILAALTDSQCSSCSQSHGDNIMPYNHAIWSLSLSLSLLVVHHVGVIVPHTHAVSCQCHCASQSHFPIIFSLSPGPSLCHTSMTLTESKPLTLSHGPTLMTLSLIVMLFDLSLLVVHHVDVVVPHT